MCVKKETVILTSRHFIGLYCHRYVSFKASKKYEETLCFEIESNKGEISYELLNKENNNVEKLSNPKSGTYEFPLVSGNHYQLHIEAHASNGHYKIYRKRKIA